jgi:small subunit ribosomal protein S11e
MQRLQRCASYSPLVAFFAGDATAPLLTLTPPLLTSYRLCPPPPLPDCRRAATQGTYVDKKCPFTGNVSIRGRILKGIVKSTKMNRTIIVKRDYLRFISKYKRYEKRHKHLAAHCSPCFLVKEGDVVTVGQCRPLSKTVRFNVLKVESSTEAGAIRAKKTFRVF